MTTRQHYLTIAMMTLFLVPGVSAWADVFVWLGTGTGDWSDLSNWEQDSLAATNLPGPTDDVTVQRNGASTTIRVDVNVVVNSLAYATTVGGFTTFSLTDTGGSITANSFSKTVLVGPTTNVDIALVQDTVFNTTQGGGWTFSGPISETGGSRKITLQGGDQLRLINAGNTFTGGIDVDNGNLRFRNGALGTGDITLGSGGGANNVALFLDFAFTGTNTNAVVVKAGSGTRRITNQSTGSFALAFDFQLEKTLDVELGANDTFALSGPVSGAGGLNVVGVGGGGARTLNFNGTGTFEGGLTVTANVSANVNSSLSRGNITIDLDASLGGTGTIGFAVGDMIDVNGTFDATSLLFDVTAVGPLAPFVLVDYSDGSITLPGDLNDLLTPASLAINSILIDTGTQLILFVPEPSGVFVLMTGSLLLAARCRRGQLIAG